MVKAIIYGMILLPLFGTLMWILSTSKTILGAIAFALIAIAIVICVVTVVKDSRE